MGSLTPRVVLVTRQTDLERLLASHATRQQAAFFLESRGQRLDTLDRRHKLQLTAVETSKRAVPADWSIAHVDRGDLDRFLFTADDIVVAIGQDGLVANLAKYLTGQPVIGITPDPDSTEGILTPLCAEVLTRLLPQAAEGDIDVERRTMVEARLDGGQSLMALNELFIGHRSHQSARYKIMFGDSEENQSSSGVVVATGTGLTGWARSILAATHRTAEFAPQDRMAAFFAREPWPSRTTGCALSYGEIADSNALTLVSRMNDGGVIFADGIEQDFLRFDWGVTSEVSIARQTLNLVAA